MPKVPRPPTPKTAPTQIPQTARTPGEQATISDAQVGKNRADFRVEKFRQVIRQKGYFLIWRKALLCTCRNPETEQARADCDVCDSSGFFYIEPLKVQGIMTNLEKKKDIYRHLGEWLEGTSMVTVEPEHRLGYRDSLEMVHSVMTFNEWIEKDNRRGTRSKLPVNHDAARYRISRMLHLMFDVNDQPVSVEEGVQFRITKDGWIEWIGSGINIPAGTIFSANYEFHPVWVVINHPHGIRDTVADFKQAEPTAQAMPVQAAVKLDYLIDDIASALPTTEVGNTLPTVKIAEAI